MVKLIVFDSNGNEVSNLDVKEEDNFNKILKRKKSILDIMLDNKIDAYYGCMGGSCSACVCELVEGEEYIAREGLHEQVYMGIPKNEFLTCIATIKDEVVGTDKEIKVKLKY